jgi:hypothetical protein
MTLSSCLMWFDGPDSVKAFMGEDYEAAHVPARAQAVLADFFTAAVMAPGRSPFHSSRARATASATCWTASAGGNAWQADRYGPNPFGSTNSVVVNSPEAFGLAA